jgi:iron(III) transport system substrate-binding protein
MKRIEYLMIGILVFVALLPQWAVAAETKAKISLPQVPVIYRGDTDQTIIRRAEWVEGARKEGTLSWWDNLSPQEGGQIISEFNKIYPFIKVTFWRGSEEQRSSKIEAEHSMGQLSVDVAKPGDFTTHYPRWRKMGIVEKYTDFIPNIRRIDKGMYSRLGDWAQIGNNVIVPIYNTSMVALGEAPKSWNDLLHPKWKGKIGMNPNMRAWYTLALGEGGWGIERTEDFLRKLKQQEPIWTAGASAGRNLLIAGEFQIIAENFLRLVIQARQNNATIDWVRAHPVVITGSTLLLPKKAPHPNSARLFIEWLFSPETAPIYEKITGYGAAFPGAGTVVAKAIDGLPLVYRTEDVVAKATELHLVEKFSQILGVTPQD